MQGSTFGDFIRRKREEKRIGLRQFCTELEFDPSRWSKVERAVLQPPCDGATLKKIAQILSIKLNSEEWTKLKDLAAFGRGEIPADIMNDKQLVSCLPLVFRSLREKPTREQLANIVDIIRQSDT